MKKLLCLLLALVMVLSLAACAESDSRSRNRKDRDEKEEKVVELKDGIVGTWTVEINFPEDSLNLNGLHIDGVPIEITFTEDGKYTMDFADNAHEIIEEKLADAIVESLYAEMEAEGYSRQEIEEMCKEETGMSVEDFAEDMVAEFDIRNSFSVEDTYLDYQIDGDKLIMDGTEMTAEVKGDKLTITECSDDTWKEVGLELPVVMERVDRS